MWQLPAGYEPLVVYEPRTWLLRVGWEMYGLLDTHEVPSTRRAKVAEVHEAAA